MKNILDALAFYASHPGWHSFDGKDKTTLSAIDSLKKRGFIEVLSSQARFTSEPKSDSFGNRIQPPN